MKNILAGLIMFTSCQAIADTKPYFENSIVSNDIDFIISDDSTAKSTLKLSGTSRKEMPDKRHDSLFDEGAYVFTLTFDDGTMVEIFAHSDFKDADEAKYYANLLAGPIGKLPLTMRDALSHVVVHKGNETAFAEHLGHFFVLYSQNMEIRIRNNVLEETVFHEAVHATLDHQYKETAEWDEAQVADGVFVTNYAANNPKGEDFAESALFAYTLYKHPDRLPTDLRKWLKNKLPNRIVYFQELFKELEKR